MKGKLSRHGKAALWYASVGWSVFPCASGGKEPHRCISSEQGEAAGFKKATTNKDQIKTWWTKYPSANIGIATGIVSGGLLVIDIDDQHDGYDSIVELKRKGFVFPETLTSNTPSGGMHLYYLVDEEIRSQTGVFAGIDIRCDGGYVVAPPSKRKEPKGFYIWDGETTPLERRKELGDKWISPAPKWLLDIAKGNIAINNKTVSVSSSGDFFDGYDPKTIGDEFDESQQASTGTRNQTLARFVGHWLAKGIDSPYELLGRAIDWDSRNSPPILNSEGLENGLKEIKRTISSIYSSHKRKNPELETDPELASKNNNRSRKYLSDKSLNPPGVLGQLVDWVTSQSGTPQRVLALGHSIAFAGAVSGRSSQTETNLRTNFYCLGVAESGVGKNASRVAISRLAHETGWGNLIRKEKVTSDSALHQLLCGGPVCLAWDELGIFLTEAEDPRGGSVKKTVISKMIEIFSQAGERYVPGKEYSGDRQQSMCHFPHCCLYGTATPATLARGLTPHAVETGFLPRVLIFESQTMRPLRAPYKVSPPAWEITNWLLIEREFQKTESTGSDFVFPNSSNLINKLISPSREAMRILDQCMIDADDRSVESSQRADGMRPIWARVAEHARKLALLAASCDQSAQVLAPHAEWAVSLATESALCLIGWIGERVADSLRESHSKRIVSIIRDLGGSASRSQITLQTRWLDRAKRESILADLVESGILTLSSQKRGKARLSTYSLK